MYGANAPAIRVRTSAARRKALRLYSVINGVSVNDLINEAIELLARERGIPLPAAEVGLIVERHGEQVA